MPGESLRALLEAGPVPEPMLRGLARDVAAALSALHAAGVVHGDLKPENVKLDAQGRAIVLDLGFARHMASGGAAGTNAGSLAYLSPERAQGAPPSAAADVFALGVMLYELACGAHPFLLAARARVSAGGGREWGSSDGKLLRRSIEVPGADEVLAAISTGRFAPPTRLAPALSPFLEALIADLLRRAPGRRPSASETAQRLADGEAGRWWRRRIASAGDASRDASEERGQSHMTPVIGREAELAALGAALGSVRDSGQGGVLWLCGDEGSGKWRLASEFAAHARTTAEPPLYLGTRWNEAAEARPPPARRWCCSSAGCSCPPASLPGRARKGSCAL